MLPVTSSHISRIGHNGTQLIVEFKNGSVYAYEGVPQAKYLEMLHAESPGAFLESRIKPEHSFAKLK